MISSNVTACDCFFHFCSFILWNCCVVFWSFWKPCSGFFVLLVFFLFLSPLFFGYENACYLMHPTLYYAAIFSYCFPFAIKALVFMLFFFPIFWFFWFSPWSIFFCFSLVPSLLLPQSFVKSFQSISDLIVIIIPVIFPIYALFSIFFFSVSSVYLSFQAA